MIWTTRQRSEGAGALHYFEDGEGPVVVLIHGVGLRAEAWSGLVPAFSKRFRVVCVDMPGHGASPLEGAKNLGDFLDRFAKFLGALPGPVLLAGHSMGGLLSVELGARLPEKIQAVAALNTVFHRSDAAAVAVQARANALTCTGLPDPEPTLERWFGADPAGVLKYACDACRHWLTDGTAADYATAYGIFAYTDGPSETALARLKCPALFLTGEDDPNSTSAMSVALASATSGQSHTIANAAHMMPMTHTDEVAAYMMSLFTKALTTPISKE